MTIEQILRSTNSAEELKNRFLIKSAKSRIANTFNGMYTKFMEDIQRTAMGIADGSLVLDQSCCRPVCSDESEPEKIQFSEDEKIELFKALKVASENALELYKKTIDCAFGNETEKKEQPKVEIEVTSTPAQEASVQTNKNYFGY